MKEEKLKKCPCCQKESRICKWPNRPSRTGKYWYYPLCFNCGMTGQEQDTPAKAIVSWNRRPLEEELVGAAKEILRAYDHSFIDEWRRAIEHLTVAVLKAEGKED